MNGRVLLNVGRAVFTAIRFVTADVAAVVTVADPRMFVRVTVQLIVCPASEGASV